MLVFIKDGLSLDGTVGTSRFIKKGPIARIENGGLR